ncbi:MAG: hypothetical protein HC875_26585 [Anaerolineales bacterium]|nr:hypothetical protein [Anaerolineales bacterium]
MNDKDTPLDSSNELEEIWSIFALEGRESLDTVEKTLLALEVTPLDFEQVRQLFRALHTFKGAVRMMGLPAMEALAHGAEDLVGLVRDEGVTLTKEMINLLLDVLDQLRQMLEYALMHRQDDKTANIAGLLARLRGVLAQYTQPPDIARPAPDDENSEKPADSFSDAAAQPSAPAAVELPAEASVKIDTPDTGIEMIDPATDPVYLQIFREIAEEELWRLQHAQTALTDGDEAAFLEIKEMADNLGHAARQMGFMRIVAVLEELVNAVDNSADQDPFTGPTVITAHLENLLVEFLGVSVPVTPAIASVQPLPQESPVEAAAPLTEVQTFLKTAQGELSHLRGALVSLGSGNEDALPEIQQVAATLKDAAQLLGYSRFIESVDNLLAVTAEPASEARNLQLNKVELALFEELVTIQEVSQTPAPEDPEGMPNFVWLFRRWHAVRVFANLARLCEVADDLHQFMQQFLADGSVSKRIPVWPMKPPTCCGRFIIAACFTSWIRWPG